MPSLKGSGVGVAVGGAGGGVAGVAVGVTVGVATGVALGIGVAVDAGVGVGVGDDTDGCRWHWQSKKAATLRMAALTTLSQTGSRRLRERTFDRGQARREFWLSHVGRNRFLEKSSGWHQAY